MEIINFTDSCVGGVVELWNRSAGFEMPYKPFTEESFVQKFINNPSFEYEGTFIAKEGTEILGFANGIINKEAKNNTGYVTFVLVAKEKRRMGTGTALLEKVTGFLAGRGKTQVDIIFFNPINLEWNIPGTDGHDHPNSPGIEKPSAGYDFCTKNGFMPVADQFSYYLPLSEFSMSEKAIKIINDLKEKNITFEFFNKDKHYGIQEMLENLGNPLWIKEINESIEKRPQNPVIIASDDGKACGFTGPLYVQESGRGYFTGIGVRSDYGGMGIGTVLFNMLCNEHKKGEAKFMSLFTGETNPARKMYEGAGFVHVKTWTDFRKEI